MVEMEEQTPHEPTEDEKLEAQLQAFLANVSTFTVEQQTRIYIKTRETKAKATRAYDLQDARFKRIMECCENHLLKQADEMGVKGFATPDGTTYTAESSKITIADEAAFFDFVKTSGDLDFFEKRVSSRHVDEYTKLTGSTPPGLNIFRERHMRVRKAADK
jgi:hypothetical protein